MKDCFDLCAALAGVLNAKEWTHEFKAEPRWTVSFEAENLPNLVVSLVPESDNRTVVSRGGHSENTFVLSVLVQQNVTGCQGAIGPLSALSDSIEQHLRTLGPLAVPPSNSKYTLMASEKVLYRPHLEEFGVFTCGMALTYKGVSR